MLVPGIRSPCHQLCATSGSVLISAMCTTGISSELLNAHSLSAPRTCSTRLLPEMDKSTMLLLLVLLGCDPGHHGYLPRSGQGQNKGMRESAREIEMTAKVQEKRKAVTLVML